MRIVELTINAFDEFANTHPLRNYCQSSAYARFMGEMGYSYDYIGYEDDSRNLVAASLILYKRIGTVHKYAYAPKGFLIDYYNVELLKSFIKDITKRYKSRKVIFLKINPEIIIGEVKIKNNFACDYNQNVKIIDDLKDLKFKRRREAQPLELIMPRISPYINLKKYDEKKLNDEFQTTLNYSQHKGLILEDAPASDINVFHDLVKSHTNQNLSYFRNLLNIFDKTDMADLLLVKVDYREFLIQAKENYEQELENNNLCNERIKDDASETNLNLKMESDRLLLQLKNNIVEATEGLKKRESHHIAGALVVKYLNRITIIIDGYDEAYAHLYPYHFLYQKMIEKYREGFDYLDLNGISADLDPNSTHYNNNQFKLGFNPIVYEFIGEFDIITDEISFKRLQGRDIISKEMYNQKV